DRSSGGGVGKKRRAQVAARPPIGRGQSNGPAPHRLLQVAASARNHVIVDVALGELLERARGELLLARRRTIARELVQNTRVLGGNEHPKILVGRVIRDLAR